MFYSFVRQSMYPPSWGDLLQAAHASSLFAGLLDFSLHGSKKGRVKKSCPYRDLFPQWDTARGDWPQFTIL